MDKLDKFGRFKHCIKKGTKNKLTISIWRPKTCKRKNRKCFTFTVSQKSWSFLKLSLQPDQRRFPTWGQKVSIGQSEWWVMVNLIGDMTLMYTDLCLVYSAVQCTVSPAASYREMGAFIVTVALRMLQTACQCCTAVNIWSRDTIFSAGGSWCACAFCMFWQSYTISPK